MVYLLGFFLFLNYANKGSDIIYILFSIILALYISSGLVLIPGILANTENSIYITRKTNFILKNIIAMLITVYQVFLLL